MDEEIKSLLDNLDNTKKVDIKEMTFYEGNISGQEVVLVRSGIGKVEAGLTTAQLITSFDVDIVINSFSRWNWPRFSCR